MSIDDIATTAHKIWGDKQMDLPHIALAAETVCGDIARQARNSIEGQPVDQAALKKELGNLISSSVRWCGDLGFDVQECIRISQEAQAKYVKKHPPQW